MHFRRFMIMGCLIGAAVFLPKSAFAEKTGLTDQPESQSSAVQSYVSEKTENAKVPKKNLPAALQSINKSQAGVVSNPVINKGSQQTVPVNPEQKPLNTAKRNNNMAQSSLGKNLKASEPSKKEEPIGQTESEKSHTVTNKIVEASSSLHHTDSKVETQRELQKKTKSIPGKCSNSSLTIRSNTSQTWNQNAQGNGENKTPSNPKEIEIITPPPQRTQSSGGQSNDQHTGTGTLNFIENWLEWDKLFHSKLSQVYYSRQAKYCNQWMNAPPSPPPKKAPFFLTYTDDLATDNDN